MLVNMHSKRPQCADAENDFFFGDLSTATLLPSDHGSSCQSRCRGDDYAEYNSR